MLITKLEYVELLDHLQALPDTWTQSRDHPGLWLGFDEQQEALCGLLFVETDTAVNAHPSACGMWSEDEAAEHLVALLAERTTYPSRVAAIELLQSALDLEQDTAEALSIALDGLRRPAQGQPDREIRLFHIVGGGYVQLHLRSGEIHATLSVPSAGRKHLAFGPPLRGVVRSSGGASAEAAAARLGSYEEEPDDARA